MTSGGMAKKLEDPRAARAAALICDKHPEYNGMLGASDLCYYAWPKVYGSTAGPFGGIGGQAMTTFLLEAWECSGSAVVFCGPKVIGYTDRFGFDVSWGERR